jgi:hypothetical protein
MAFDRALFAGLCSGAVSISMAAAVLSESSRDTSVACKDALFQALSIWAIVTVTVDAMPVLATISAICCCHSASSTTEEALGVVLGAIFVSGIIVSILGGLVLSVLTLATCSPSVSVCVVPGTFAEIVLGVAVGYGLFGFKGQSKGKEATEGDPDGASTTEASV